MSNNNPGGSPPPLSPRGNWSPYGAAPLVPAFIFIVLIFGFAWYCLFCRIEPGSDQIAILIHKTGKDLPPDKIIATSADEKGIRLEVLPEGRYFRDPYSWSWQIGKITDIPAGKLGVLTRLYGKDLPP